jgi:phosphohistidine phosphatase
VEIYLIRHGIAVEPELANSDSERWLTPRGVARTQSLAHQLKETVGKFDVIVTSPLIRAQQTAQVLVANNLSKTLEIQDCLAPGGTLAAWLSWLQAYGADQRPLHRVIVVGHAPDLGRWTEQLVFGQVVDRLQIKKSGMAVVESPDPAPAIGNCQLLALVQPKYWL